MSAKPQNLYETILDWGYDRIDDGVTYPDFEEMLRVNNYELTGMRAEGIFLKLFVRMDGRSDINYRTLRGDKFGRYSLTLEAVFRHLERVELLEARASSRNAMLMAAGSLLLAALVGVCQIAIAVWTM